MSEERYHSFCKANVDEWFVQYMQILKDKNIHSAAQVWNLDEVCLSLFRKLFWFVFFLSISLSLCSSFLFQTSVNDERKTVRVAAVRGEKAVLPRPSNSAGHVTFIPFLCADPNLKLRIPPVYVFAGKKFMSNYLANAESDSLGVCTQKGSVTKEVSFVFLILFCFFSFVSACLCL